MQKARRHIPKNAPTACRHAVSGTISLPFRGTISPFPHGTSPLSLTRQYLALEGGPPRFRPCFTGMVLLRNAHREARAFRLRAGCPLWCAVPRASPIHELGCQKQLLDYDDLLVMLRQSLLLDEAARTTISRQYRHILVDEYQ